MRRAQRRPAAGVSAPATKGARLPHYGADVVGCWRGEDHSTAYVLLDAHSGAMWIETVARDGHRVRVAVDPLRFAMAAERVRDELDVTDERLAGELLEDGAGVAMMRGRLHRWADRLLTRVMSARKAANDGSR